MRGHEIAVDMSDVWSNLGSKNDITGSSTRWGYWPFGLLLHQLLHNSYFSQKGLFVTVLLPVVSLSLNLLTASFK